MHVTELPLPDDGERQWTDISDWTGRTARFINTSAIAAIDTWTSPALLIHGDDDRNVDFSQTVRLVQLLRAKGTPYELIVYPDEVRTTSCSISRWLHAFGATDAFFDRKLLGGEAVRAEGRR